MKTITLQTTIDAPVEKVWEYWTSPVHITKWNFASPEWHCPKADNDLRNGGRFSWRMEARDGSMGFDYSGTYRTIEAPGLTEKRLDDGRNVMIRFEWVDGKTLVTETFEPDDNDIELQRQGWQAILENFRGYVENSPNG